MPSYIHYKVAVPRKLPVIVVRPKSLGIVLGKTYHGVYWR